MLNELKEYKAIHGSCLVPTSYSKSQRLVAWINNQRRQYKKFKEGKPCNISMERIKALHDIGFVWYPGSLSSMQEHSKQLTRTALLTLPVQNHDLRSVGEKFESM